VSSATSLAAKNRIDALEAKIAEQNSVENQELNSRLNEFENRLNQELAALPAQDSGLTERIAALEANQAFPGLEDRIGTLEKTLEANLEERIVALEDAGSGQDMAGTSELEKRLMTLEQITTPATDLEQILSRLETRLSSMEANMEKAAAAAAAKVIREELQNLLANQD